MITSEIHQVNAQDCSSESEVLGRLIESTMASQIGLAMLGINQENMVSINTEIEFLKSNCWALFAVSIRAGSDCQESAQALKILLEQIPKLMQSIIQTANKYYETAKEYKKEFKECSNHTRKGH